MAIKSVSLLQYSDGLPESLIAAAGGDVLPNQRYVSRTLLGLDPWSDQGVAYKAGDYVQHGGFVYVCIADNTSAAANEPGVGDAWSLSSFPILHKYVGTKQVQGSSFCCINHGLGTKKLTVQVYQLVGNEEIPVMAAFSFPTRDESNNVIDPNNYIRIDFGETVANSTTFSVVIMAAE